MGGEYLVEDSDNEEQVANVQKRPELEDVIKKVADAGRQNAQHAAQQLTEMATELKQNRSIYSKFKEIAQKSKEMRSKIFFCVTRSWKKMQPGCDDPTIDDISCIVYWFPKPNSSADNP